MNRKPTPQVDSTVTNHRRWMIWQSPTGRFTVLPPRELEQQVRSFTTATKAEAVEAINAWYLEHEEGTLWARDGSPWLAVGCIVAGLAIGGAVAWWLA